MVFEVCDDGGKYILTCDGVPFLICNGRTTAHHIRAALELDGEVMGREAVDLTVLDCQKILGEVRDLLTALKGGE